jgi:hypothetical protein
MSGFGVAGLLFFSFVFPVAAIVAVVLVVRRHLVEKAEEAASIAWIQAQAHESEEKIWPPRPSASLIDLLCVPRKRAHTLCAPKLDGKPITQHLC